MSSDLSSKCRTCLGDSNFFHQLYDYVDENYKILEMLDGIVPQIDIKSNNQFSTLVCQLCVERLLTSYKFQQLCIETNNRLHDLLGIAVPKLEKVLDPLTGESNMKMKQEVDDDVCYEREINPEELEVSLKSDNDNDWGPAEDSSGSDTYSSNEKLSVLKEKSTKKSPLKEEEHLDKERLDKVKIRIKNFPCKVCGKVLESYYRLKRHERMMHTENRLYPCKTCNLTFDVEETLKVHLESHKAMQNNCENMKNDTSEIGDINDNKETENLDSRKKQTFQCPDCPKCFEKKASFSAHFKMHKKRLSNKLMDNDKNITTAVEGNDEKKETGVYVKTELEITSDDLETNDDFVDTGIGEVEKPNKSNKRSGTYTCEICLKIFDRPYRLKRHYSVHSLAKPHECGICKYRFSSVNILKAHISQHENDTCGNFTSKSRPEGFKCPDCPRRFEKQASLSAHRQSHTRNSSECNYPCTICERKFTNMRYLTEHITKKHPEVEKHKCDQCEKSFVLHAHLVEHLNRHKGNKNLVCLICEKEFSYNNTLKEHMRTHSGESPYLCPQCGKTFRSSSNLRQHMERHIGLKKYQCPECPSRFNCRSDLIKHVSTHTKAKPHVCDICGSRFTRGYSLQKHKLLHSGERPFKCDQCNMTFVIIYHLKRHMRTHTGEKPYKCKYCERAYAESGDLTKHLRTHVGENTYICDQCPMAFKYQAELREHQAEHYKMAQKLLQQTQKISTDVKEHEVNDNHNEQSSNNTLQQLPSIIDLQNQQIITSNQSHHLPLVMATYSHQMPLIEHRQQLNTLEEEQQNQQSNTENIINRQENLDIKNLSN